MQSNNVTLRKIGEHGKPGAPGHSVEFEASVSRREVFRMVLPFLVASLAIGVEKVSQDDSHSQLDDSQPG